MTNRTVSIVKQAHALLDAVNPDETVVVAVDNGSGGAVLLTRNLNREAARRLIRLLADEVGLIGPLP